MENEKEKSVFSKKEVWIAGVIGIIVGIVLLYLIELIPIGKNKTNIGETIVPGEVIATSKAGKVTEKNLYKEMKKTYPISYVLELVDKPILEKKYKLTNEQEDEINKQVETILNQYKNYGYTEEQFFSENGFENKEDFINYMKLDYRRNLCCIDYFKTVISEEEIKNYYDSNEIYGKINTKHMLVQISSDVTDEDALKTANEIIGKLNSGISFDDVANEYTGKIVFENVDFDSFNASSYAEGYVSASKALEVGAYTKEAVKTDFGYHIIYCISKEEKPSLEQVKDDIVELLGQGLEESDQYIRYKALIKLREENGVKFIDSKYEKEYNEYCEQING